MKHLLAIALLAILAISCRKEKAVGTEEKWIEYRQKTGDTTEYFNIEDEASLEILRQMMDEWEQDIRDNPKPSHDGEGFCYYFLAKTTAPISSLKIILGFENPFSSKSSNCSFSVNLISSSSA